MIPLGLALLLLFQVVGVVFSGGSAAAATVPGWKLVGSDHREMFAAVDAEGTSVLAVGVDPDGIFQRAERYRSGDWVNIFLPSAPKPSSLSGVDLTTSGDAWLVGRAGPHGLVERWAGGHVAVYPLPALPSGYTQTLADISAVDANTAFAVGSTVETASSTSAGAILQWNGTNWATLDLTSINTHELNAVEAISSTDVWVGGTSGGKGSIPLLAHWNGSSWTVATLPDIGSAVIRELKGFATGDAWAVGSQQVAGRERSLVLHWDGLAWTKSPVPVLGQGANELRAIDGTSSQDLWAVGGFSISGDRASALALHRGSGGWTVSPTANVTPLTRQTPLNGVAAVSGSTVWAVGILPSVVEMFGQDLAHDSELTIPSKGVATVAHRFVLQGSLSFSRYAFAGGRKIDVVRHNPDGSKKQLPPIVTDDHGVFRLSDVPPQRGSTRYELRFAPDAPWGGSSDSTSIEVAGISNEVSLVASDSNLVIGEAVRLSGSVRHHDSIHEVRVYADPAGSDRKLLSRLRIRDDGSFETNVVVKRNTVFQAVIDGDEVYEPAVSPQRSVKTHPIVHTKMVETDGRSGRYAIYDYDPDCPSSSHQGCPAVKTWFVPALPGLEYQVILQVHAQGRWITTNNSRFRLSASGSQVVHFFYRRDDPAIGLPFRIKSLFHGTRTYGPAASGWVYFKVVR